MTNLLERCLPAYRFCFLALLLALAACGPGTGGTGTGPGSFSSVSSGVSGVSGGQGPGSGIEGGGIPPLAPTGGCGAACERLDLTLEEARVELVTGCGSFVFAGSWQVDENSRVALPGVLENPSTGSSVAVTLRLQFSGPAETSASVTVIVTDAAGTVLVGPQLLGRVDSIAPRLPTSGCPF